MQTIYKTLTDGIVKTITYHYERIIIYYRILYHGRVLLNILRGEKKPYPDYS